MAIYRPPKARWPLAVAMAVAGLALGLMIGLVVGDRDVDPVTAGETIRTELIAAASSLEVAAVEYRESVSGGEVTAPAEYDGALAALDSSRARYLTVRPALISLFPDQVAVLDDGYDDIRGLMEERTDAAAVTAGLERLEALLKGESEPD